MARLKWDGDICRSTYFAEAVVECDGERYLLYLPLVSSSLRRVERFARLHRHLLSSYVPRLEILSCEMRYVNALGREVTSHLLRESLPRGESFADALASIADGEEAQRLIKAVDELQGALLCANVSHNAVRGENIIIDDEGAMHLLRWYYATDGIGGDDEAFDALRELIASRADFMLCESAPMAYSTAAMFENHLYVRHLHEGLAAVEEPTGWGFVNCDNEIVIEPCYLWVSDFSEGRAEVETASGMGVINRQGEFVIPPIYESIEYDCSSGRTRAWLGERCVEFDYEGVEIDSVAESLAHE